MKELLGTIKTWEGSTGEGEIQADDGETYPFTKREWVEESCPEVHGQVRVICQDGRKVSKVEYLLIEGWPRLTVKVDSEEGRLISTEQRRLIGGPWRMRSDALAWMVAARELHSQVADQKIEDLSGLLLGVHPLISLRGSVIKYCYGLSIELYLKWILIEANQNFKESHELRKLVNKVPPRVKTELRKRYSDFQDSKLPTLRMSTADVSGVCELKLDWSTFDKFISNLENQKFIIGRYATPESYSIYPSLSNKLSKEMNSYIDSRGFFDLADDILSYEPDLDDYS
ncbi:MAG: hypothetical protein OXO50_09355 [Caldilineaceae bacterium]|nr:hypothetical protein [Caldilineaceae bacterium]